MTMQPQKPVTWLITGASGGLGLAYVQAALAHGDNVVGGARHIEPLQSLDFGDQLMALTLDVTDPISLETAANATVERYGAVDIAVCNAGGAIYGAVEELAPGDLLNLLRLNLTGTVNTIQAVLPAMRRQGRGRIVVISSMSGFVGAAGMGAYNASKFAIEGLSEALSEEVAPLGIKVLIVEPGPFKTSFDSAAKVAQRSIDDYRETAGRNVTMMTHMDWATGDPKLAAAAVIEVGHAAAPPSRLACRRRGSAADRYSPWDDRAGGWLDAVGDVNGRALLTYQGKYQGRIAADHILGRFNTSIVYGGVLSPDCEGV